MKRGQDGFIIVEALVTMLIMGVALLSLSLLVNATQRNEVRASQRNQTSLDLVEREVAGVRRLAWSQVALTQAPGASSTSCDSAIDSGAPTEWNSHRKTGAITSQAPLTGGSLAATACQQIGRSSYDVYRYVYCVAADGNVAAAQAAACPIKRVRIVVESSGAGLARRLPPDGIAYRDLVMTQALYRTPLA